MDRAIDSLQRLTNMTTETDALYERLLTENPGNLIYLAEMLELARKLERERDEARTERDILKLVDPSWPLYIQQLERERDEWATMCGQYKQERDEAKEQAAHWKSEYEIVEARLCGWKHPRDNGIIFEHEVIPILETKIAQLEGKTAKPKPLWFNQREIPADIKEGAK